MKIVINTLAPNTDTSIAQLPVLTAGDRISIDLQFLDKGAPVQFTDPEIKFVMYQTGAKPRAIVAVVSSWMPYFVDGSIQSVQGYTGLLSLRTQELMSLVASGAVQLTLGVRVASGDETRTYVTAPVTVRAAIEEADSYDPIISPEWATEARVAELIAAAIPTLTDSVINGMQGTIELLAKQSDMDAVIETISKMNTDTSSLATIQQLGLLAETVGELSAAIDSEVAQAVSTIGSPIPLILALS